MEEKIKEALIVEFDTNCTKLMYYIFTSSGLDEVEDALLIDDTITKIKELVKYVNSGGPYWQALQMPLAIHRQLEHRVNEKSKNELELLIRRITNLIMKIYDVIA